VSSVELERIIARLVARQTSGRIGYWAAFADERGVTHFSFTADPAYASLSPENAARRTGAVAAVARAVERYRATLRGAAPEARPPARRGAVVGVAPASPTNGRRRDDGSQR